MRWLCGCIIAVLTMVSSVPHAKAAGASVDLELVMAADASGSVDADEWQLQLSGIATAFRDPTVLEAIKAGQRGAIAVALLVWADASRDKDISPWFVIDSAQSAEAFALIVERYPRSVEGGTGIGSAIAESIRQLQYNDIESSRRVVDVSGDGVETPIREDASILLPSARSMAHAFGVTVNGLAIINEVHDLDDYYRAEVIVGAGSFVEKAKNYVDFKRAMREKLLREIVPNVASREPRGRLLARR
jgi:Protein of unknown function (DUF1194)